MKKCPTCGKTFEDNLRFCQADGTPLVDDAAAAEPAAEEPFDPYATIVGVPKNAIPASTPPEASVEPPPAPEVSGEPLDISPSGTVSLRAVDAGPSSSADAGSVGGESASSIPVAPPDDILDLGSDPLKTMYVSDAEMNEVLGTVGQGAETPAEEIRADEAQVEAPPAGADFGSMSPPPSPFSEPTTPEETPVPAPPSFLDSPTPSPGSEAETQVQMDPPFQPEPAQPAFEPEPSYQDAPTVFQPQPDPPQFSDAAPVAMQDQGWSPPPPPTPEWQNQQIDSNTPFQPPPAGAGGENKTLAIISLVLGILSVCCYVAPLTGLAAVITGFMANKKAKQDPQNYGGKGLALAGIICGGVFFLIGVAYWIYIIVVIGFVGLSSLSR